MPLSPTGTGLGSLLGSRMNDANTNVQQLQQFQQQQQLQNNTAQNNMTVQQLHNNMTMQNHLGQQPQNELHDPHQTTGAKPAGTITGMLADFSRALGKHSLSVIKSRCKWPRPAYAASRADHEHVRIGSNHFDRLKPIVGPKAVNPDFPFCQLNQFNRTSQTDS